MISSTIRSRVLASLIGLLVGVSAVACGSHRIKYRLPSEDGAKTYESNTVHNHGIGPLIIGGGLLTFSFFSEISPALIDYTGAVDARTTCPDGFAAVEHFHTSEQNYAAGMLSSFMLVNAEHRSTVRWTCLAAVGVD
jgi:hypothetical protein